MKSTFYKNILASMILGVALTSGFTAKAQYPTASVLLSGHHLGHYNINSSEDYANLEQNINTLSAHLREAHENNPNLEYTPNHSESGEIIGFVVTGAADAVAASEISYYLMQLQVLGEVARTASADYLPNIDDSKLSRVSKKQASK